MIKEFCFKCKAPRPHYRPSGNSSLDSFIMKSWSNTSNTNTSDGYIRWIEYTQLTNVQEETSLHHGCTHIADWSDEVKRVIMKKIVDGHNAQLFDFYQVSGISVV
jgi:hypothetical protein